MADDVSVSLGIQQFIESMGVYFEQYGISRTSGRILALLMVAERPLSLDDMASALQVSRASISINVRMAQSVALAELITLPGDRRDYYRSPEGAWERVLQVDIDATIALRRIAERGLTELPPDNKAGREHLEELVDFCNFAVEERRGAIHRWHEYRKAKQQARHQTSEQ